MKRLSVALTVLGLSVGAFAALPAATDPNIVSVPQLPGGFVIGGSGFYLQPSDSKGDLDYASFNSGTATSFSSSLQNVQPGYNWGWGANIGYIFPNTGNDINLSYFQLDTSDNKKNTFGNVGPNSIPGISPINVVNGGNLLANTITFSDVTAQYDLNQVDLTAGQYMDVGCRLMLHPNVGLRWADLDRKLYTGNFAPAFNSVSGGATSSISRGSINITEDSDFSGIGPLVGLDASYYIGMGFGAVAHTDAGLLVGDINSTNHDRVKQNDNLSIPSTYAIFNSFSSGNQERIVPVIDAKLGADYTFVFNNAANSDLTLETGWMFSDYYNAVDGLSIESPTTSAETLIGSNSIVARKTSNFGLEGPYVSLVFHA